MEAPDRKSGQGMKGTNPSTAKAFSPLRAGTVGTNPGTAKDTRLCGPERGGPTPALRRTLAPAGRNGRDQPRHCEGLFAAAGRKGWDQLLKYINRY